MEKFIERLIGEAGLGDLLAKVLNAERLLAEDGLRLYQCPDLTAVGGLANLVRERHHGQGTWFVRNQHINYTNVCRNRCRFCSFSVSAQDPRAYVLTADDIARQVAEFLDRSITEIHIVGGVHPGLDYSYYADLLRAVKRVRPQVHVKAFTVVELAQIARAASRPLAAVLHDLKDAGLDSVPGGGAEVFSDRIRQELFPLKLDADAWLQVARTVHLAGLPSNATMLHGHIETAADKVQHLLRLRELQDETRGFRAYLPLPFHPENTALSHLPPVTGEQILREIAVGRLLLDNVPHIKAFWVMATPAVAQVAQWYGADDLDGTVLRYEITRGPGKETRQELTVDALTHLIRNASRNPMERDGNYRPISPPPPIPQRP